MIILAIETSCDETAVAIIKSGKENFTILSEAVSSQIKIHAEWGGVVPNLAAREHLKNIIPVIEYSLKKANVNPKEIDLIATTKGPGLIPALLIGNSVSKTLAWIWGKPLLGINHIEGHIYSNFVDPHPSPSPKTGKGWRVAPGEGKIKFPVLCLIVSGGHTQLVLMKDHLQYKIIGQTLDDAAGEAFDKVARMLGLGYPGGPAIAAGAAKFKIQNSQPKAGRPWAEKLKVNFPRPMINSKDFNFSFSGLKTAVLYEIKKLKTINQEQKTIICHEFQQAVIDVLISKAIRAVKKFNPKTIMIAGGVSANKELRCQLKQTLKKLFPALLYREPDARYSIDNAVMIAAAANFRWQKMSIKQKNYSLNNWKIFATDANLKLT
ncbi:MAG: tRNA (adenosine(37)-N6)-threonylcarbamoyltransferase complex transferase subunit TsaD [Patescibacteria group bacterium]